MISEKRERMDSYKNIHFHGTFRDYQQRVLDNADKYLNDGKINIVAAPGSGKTVLGLELIRRIGEPCIILSPTTAIREQWGMRFRDLFLDDISLYETYFSNDLHKIRLVNSVTYQALYTALEKVSQSGDDDADCSDVDLLKILKEYNIKTICLDEAHHLKNEWQKALEKFIGILDNDVKIISLTATPPYDSGSSEWNRYVNICGEIDEEIFVPELVAQNTLCPHQDYVYFNYPTQAEAKVFKDHRKQVVWALNEIAMLRFLQSVSERLNSERDYDRLFSNVKEYIALLVLFRYFGFETDKKLIRILAARKGLPNFDLSYAETAIQFLLGGDLLSDEQKDEIIDILKDYSVYDKRKVTLTLNEKLKRTLISSVGKLESIGKIAESEFEAMGKSLRMLILTDYIKKENVEKIATEDKFNSVNVVSIFETLRRNNDAVNIAVLSGSLVILPDFVDLSSVKHNKKNIPGTRYCIVDISGSNHDSVEFVGRLFERGEIQILVGTKSLLGEGWDSPCINSLILASFVGSFVLSNQMRGRAIRIDKENPQKTANIWHLVTVEPEYIFKENALEKFSEYVNQERNELFSWDFDVLKRRFESFMGPNYSTGKIENGIQRITAIYPPYDKNGIERINREMLALAKNRAGVQEKWENEVSGSKIEVDVETEVPKEKRVPVFTFFNFALSLILSGIEATLIRGFIPSVRQFGNSFRGLLFIAAQALILFAFYILIRKAVTHFNPARSIKALGIAVYKTLLECDLISGYARVEVNQSKGLGTVNLVLKNAPVHDQNVFNTAMTEMLSPIENPRYILIKRGFLRKYNYQCSFACPSIIGKKKEYVEILSKKLKTKVGKFEAVYTHKETGRKMILKCRRKSYITYNEKAVNKTFKVSHWE